VIYNHIMTHTFNHGKSPTNATRSFAEPKKVFCGHKVRWPNKQNSSPMDFHALQARAMHAPINPKTQMRQILYEAMADPKVQGTRYKMDFGDATKEEAGRKAKAMKRRINKFKTTKKEILNELRQNGEIKASGNRDAESITLRDKIIVNRQDHLEEHGVPLTVEEKKYLSKLQEEFEANNSLLERLRDRVYSLSHSSYKRTKHVQAASTLSIPHFRNKDGGDEGMAPDDADDIVPADTDDMEPADDRLVGLAVHEGDPIPEKSKVEVFCRIGKFMGKKKKNFINSGVIVFFDNATPTRGIEKVNCAVDFDITRRSISHLSHSYKRRYDNTYIVRYDDNELEEGVVRDRITLKVSRAMKVLQSDLEEKKRKEKEAIRLVGKSTVKTKPPPERTELFKKLQADREARIFKIKEVEAAMTAKRKKQREEERFKRDSEEKLFRQEHNRKIRHQKKMEALKAQKELEKQADVKAIQRAQAYILKPKEKAEILKEQQEERRFKQEEAKKKVAMEQKKKEDKELLRIKKATQEHRQALKVDIRPHEDITFAQLKEKRDKELEKRRLVEEEIRIKKSARDIAAKAHQDNLEKQNVLSETNAAIDILVYWSMPDERTNEKKQNEKNGDEDSEASSNVESFEQAYHRLVGEIAGTKDRKKLAKLKSKRVKLLQNGRRIVARIKKMLKRCKDLQLKETDSNFPNLNDIRSVLKSPLFQPQTKKQESESPSMVSIKTVPIRRKEVALKKVFEAIDIDKSGLVSLNEIKNMLVSNVQKNPHIYNVLNSVASLRPFLEYDLSDLRETFDSVDKDGNGLDFDEFCALIKLILQEHKDDICKKLFDEFDVEQSGTIPIDELSMGLKRNKYVRNLIQNTPLQSLLLPESLKSALSKIDKSRDGLISRQELSAFVDAANTRADHEFEVTYKGKKIICGNRAERDRLENLERVHQEELKGARKFEANQISFQKGNTKFVVPKEQSNSEINAQAREKKENMRRNAKENKDRIKVGIQAKLAKRMPLLATEDPNAHKNQKHFVRSRAMMAALKMQLGGRPPTK
jgi:Ca2+-binding EF-hand superfamily protein